MIDLNHQTLDSICDDFKLVNTREKCEFLALFPARKKTTIEGLADEGRFSNNPSVVLYYLEQYKDYILKPKQQDKKHQKPLWLNMRGLSLQKVAQYMIVTEHMMRTKLRLSHDYLELFFPKANPEEMIRILLEIYEKDVRTQAELCRWPGDSNTKKIISRLNDYGLIETQRKGEGRTRTNIITTDAGVYYYKYLLKPALEYLAGDRSNGNTAKIENGELWKAYLKSLKTSNSS